MTRYVRVPIEAEERECGDCQYIYGWEPDWWCDLFLTRKQTERRLHCKGCAPQRCPQCLAAEVKTEVKEDGK